MNTPVHSQAPFFEAKYKADKDPWDFEKSDYELRRYRAILKALEGCSFHSALEPGCSVGVLSESLATLCNKLLAFDFSETAVKSAQERCGKFKNIQIRCLGLEDIDTFSGFDLVVLSEIGYYFSEEKWTSVAERIIRELQPNAVLLAAHWTGFSKDHEISGDTVHKVLLANENLRLDLSERHAGFRLERWTRL